MTIAVQPGTRLEKIVKMLLSKEKLINEEKKGSIEINFAGESVQMSVKTVIQSE